MSLIDFDRIIERRGSDSSKWAKYAGRDVIPMWIADMDFAAPPPVINALEKRLAHGVFGYADPWPSLIEAVVEGVARDHGWRIEPDWLVWMPGMVTGLNLAARAVGGTGDGVFTATPIYPPFLGAPGFSGRRLVTAPLVREGSRWGWDFDAVANALDDSVRLFMLCNPHNPVGRVFDRAELLKIAELTGDRVILSDEIHCGLVLEPGLQHIPIASLDETIAARTITLMAPSKTWNVPGLFCAFAIIPDPGLRRRFVQAMRGIVPAVNVMGLVAAEAAYREGASWRAELLDYLRGNRDLVESSVATMGPLAMTAVEATYLAWIDCTALGEPDPVAFFERAGVGLADGAAFGAPGFVRLNFGCPRAVLDEALGRMKNALLS